VEKKLLEHLHRLNILLLLAVGVLVIKAAVAGLEVLELQLLFPLQVRQTIQ
jgi:hypothetical protein